MTTTTTVSAGRGTRDGELSPTSWGEFRIDLLTTVAAWATTVHFDGTGRGRYTSPLTGDTTYEDSYTIVATVPEPRLQSLRGDLSILAAKYGQECIAITTGATHFVAPPVPVNAQEIR